MPKRALYGSAQLLEYSLSVAAIVSIGHRSTAELAAATLGSMTASVTGYSILLGMMSALDSMLPQAWGGPDSQKKLVGLWTLRMAVILTFTLVVCQSPQNCRLPSSQRL